MAAGSGDQPGSPQTPWWSPEAAFSPPVASCTTGCGPLSRRQFQRAENHFSMAIQHSPQRAQYYLHRARIRLLMQNVSGARQDVVTALLLDPKQPKVGSCWGPGGQTPESVRLAT